VTVELVSRINPLQRALACEQDRKCFFMLSCPKEAPKGYGCTSNVWFQTMHREQSTVAEIYCFQGLLVADAAAIRLLFTPCILGEGQPLCSVFLSCPKVKP